MPARYSIRTSFDPKTLPVLTDEALEPIVDKYVKGDQLCRNVIIETNIKLAISLAAIFASRYPYRADDLGGEAMLLLVRSVDRFPLKARDNRIRGYLHSNVWHGLQRFCWEDKLIRVSQSTLYTHKEKGKEIKFDIQDIDSVLHNTLLDCEDQQLDTDNLELISAEVTEDSEILRLRLIGFNDQDIADAMLQPLSFVVQRKQLIINRLTFVLRKLQ